MYQISVEKNGLLKNYFLKLTSIVTFAFLVSSQAYAGIIAVVGNGNGSNMASLLNINGHSATYYSSAGLVDYTGVDTVVLLRASGDANMINFVSLGGLLITEWDASWALNVANLLSVTDSGHPLSRPSDPVEITAAGIAAGLSTGVANPFLDGGQSQHYRSLTGITSDVEVLMQWSSDDTAVAIGGAYNAGSVLINTLDWGDSFGQDNNASEQMLLNMVNYSFSGQAAKPVPEPAAFFFVVLGFGFLLHRSKRKA